MQRQIKCRKCMFPALCVPFTQTDILTTTHKKKCFHMHKFARTKLYTKDLYRKRFAQTIFTHKAIFTNNVIQTMFWSAQKILDTSNLFHRSHSIHYTKPFPQPSFWRTHVFISRLRFPDRPPASFPNKNYRSCLSKTLGDSANCGTDILGLKKIETL